MRAKTMIIDWVSALPGMIAGGIVAAGGAILNSWKHDAVVDIKISGLREEFQKSEKVLREEFQKSERLSAAGEMRRDIEFDKAIDRLNGVATQIAGFTSEQAAVNKVTVKTMDGISRRLEEHSVALAQNTASVSFARQLIDQIEQRVNRVESRA